MSGCHPLCPTLGWQASLLCTCSSSVLRSKPAPQGHMLGTATSPSSRLLQAARSDTSRIGATVLLVSTAPSGSRWWLVAAALTFTARHAAALFLAWHQQWQARWPYLNRAGAPVPGLWSHAYAASLAGPGSSPAFGIACQLDGSKTILSVLICITQGLFVQLQPHTSRLR